MSWEMTGPVFKYGSVASGQPCNVFEGQASQDNLRVTFVIRVWPRATLQQGELQVDWTKGHVSVDIMVPGQPLQPELQRLDYVREDVGAIRIAPERVTGPHGEHATPARWARHRVARKMAAVAVGHCNGD